MSVIEWDNVDNRLYETGVDRGVLYLQSGEAIPWSGLTSVSQTSDRESNPVYFDGMKVCDSVTLGDFAGTIHAITYPNEMNDLEGSAELVSGFLASEQPPQLFNLSYRTLIGNGDGNSEGYKIHIIYNVLASPSDREFASLSDSPNLVEFEWNITATPEEILGIRPTAHFVLNSLDLDAGLLEVLEGILYGTADAAPRLLSIQDLVDYVITWSPIEIRVESGEIWSAEDAEGAYISMIDSNTFQIDHANATYIDVGVYTISDGVSDV